MSKIKFGSTNIKNLYLGSTQIKKAYIGSSLLFSSYNEIPTGFHETNYTKITDIITTMDKQIYTYQTYPAETASGTKSLKDANGNTHTLAVTAKSGSSRTAKISYGNYSTGTTYNNVYNSTTTTIYIIYSVVFDTNGYMYVWFERDTTTNGSTTYTLQVDVWKFTTSSGYTWWRGYGRG